MSNYVFSYNAALYIYRAINDGNFAIELHNRLQSFAELHDYPTRNNQDFQLPRFNKTKSQYHLHYTGMKIWNSIPDHIKICSSVSSFKTGMKKYLFGKLNDDLEA